MSADYGFDSCKKYWWDVQLRDRRSPVPRNILFTSTFSGDFFVRFLLTFFSLSHCSKGQAADPKVSDL